MVSPQLDKSTFDPTYADAEYDLGDVLGCDLPIRVRLGGLARPTPPRRVPGMI